MTQSRIRNKIFTTVIIVCLIIKYNCKLQKVQKTSFNLCRFYHNMYVYLITTLRLLPWHLLVPI